jgi:PAS domain S-box-containing protein
MPEPKLEEVLLFQPEWCRVAFSSICDAVIITDTEGRVTFLNPVAEALTGWTLKQAAGASLETVFKIVNHETHKAIESPTARALRDGVIIGLANHTLLIAKDGTECPIEDSASPICNDRKEVAGVVLVFRDVSERRRQDLHLQDALTFADNIIATMPEPFVVLDRSLRIKMANRSFYRHFQVTQMETEGRHIYELGNGQWNIPRLRTLLEEALLQNHFFQNFDMEHDFPVIGKRSMLLNVTRFELVDNQSELILLAIKDITERKRMEVAVQTSEVRYRRLFETAKDGRSMSGRNTDYAKWIRLDDSESVSIDVHPDDRPELASCLLMFGLHFRCEERESGDEQLTFGSGTTVDHVHVALTEFDRLSRQWPR